MVDATRGGELLKRIASLRKQLAGELGIIVPAVHIRDDLRLRPGGYRVLLSGVTIAEGEVFVHRVLAIDPTGTATRAPARRSDDRADVRPAREVARRRTSAHAPKPRVAPSSTAPR